MVSHPVHRVFWCYRDQLPEAAATIPGIQGIEVESREEDGDIVRIHNVWTGDSELPKFAQRFMSKEHQRWDDLAVWYESKLRCDWHIKPRVFREAVVCIGTTRFVEEGMSTRIVLSGELTVDPTKVPGIPDVLAETLGPKIEAYIVATIQPRVEANNLAIGKFLDGQKPKS